MKEIGEFLKDARIKNGVSLEEVSEDIDISVVQLENIEEGNVRAFKDVFSLRELVKNYGKYLGVETDSIMDEFNDFMFEHTSKISIEDILEARQLAAEKESTEPVKTVFSPYTRIKKRKLREDLKIKPIIIGVVSILILFLIIFILYQIFDKEKSVTTELKTIRGVEDLYERTY